MTSILIADDQALVRVGLRKILEAEPETNVVGEAGDGEDAVSAARRLEPDVVLMDIRMPVLDGIEATRRIVRERPGTRIVANGEALLAPSITRAVIEEFARQSPASPPAPSHALEQLTPREHEVLDLLARGLSNPEICERLVISEATAKTHVARILQKLDLRDRVQAVIYAYETGLIAPGARG
ncbi:MAG: response regulator transcription factor [Actinobacteria bacterium]|nr:MAG: response regulator transcription factor [Actinomycetota bacterium]